MAPVTLYHNPKCSKSRKVLALLEENGIEFRIVEYLETPLRARQIKALARKIGVSVREITRTNEAEYQTQNLDNASDGELAEAIASTPILMQRPIVARGNKASIGRPPESVLEVLYYIKDTI